MPSHPQTTKNGQLPGNLAGMYGYNGQFQFDNANMQKTKMIVPQDLNIHSDPNTSDLHGLSQLMSPQSFALGRVQTRQGSRNVAHASQTNSQNLLMLNQAGTQHAQTTKHQNQLA